MNRRMRLGCVIAVVAAGAVPVFASGADDEGDDTLLRNVLDRMARLEADNAALRQEVDDLRAANSDNWLTEQRATEIRAVVADVLADADVRASLLQDSMTAGWNEHFFLASADGRFKLELDGQMQIRWVYNWHDNRDKHRQGFENTRTKLTFRGHVFNPDLTYLVRGNFARSGGAGGGDFRLEDAWVRYDLTNDWSVRFGQFKLPFNREELIASAHQLAVERSLVNESLNLGRTQGIELAFNGEDLRVALMTGDGGTDNVGGFGIVGPGGNPQNSIALNEDIEYHVGGRAEYKLAGTWGQFADFTSPPGEPFGLLVGAGMNYQVGEHGSASFSETEEEWIALTADVSAEWGGAGAFAAFTYHQIDGPTFTTEVYGLVVQGSVYFTPKFEVFGRYEWGQFQISTPGFSFHTLNVLTTGFNYYLDGHDVKFTTDFGIGFTETDVSWDSDIAGWRFDNPGTQHQIVFRTQFQLLF